MQTWHDGLPNELPEIVALPERPGMRVRREQFVASAPSSARADELSDVWQPLQAGGPLTR